MPLRLTSGGEVLTPTMEVEVDPEARRTGMFPYGRGLFKAKDEIIRCVPDDRRDEGTDCEAPGVIVDVAADTIWLCLSLSVYLKEQ
jgi:hypothetical protein